MAVGLAGGYGLFAGVLGRFLYPARRELRWQFVAPVDRLAVGESLAFTTSAGESVHVTRRAEEDFTALSSVCPHLGCQVHWQVLENRYFCPCHAGVFDAAGVGVAGPPVGMELASYPLEVRNGLLYIGVSAEGLATS